ncbi:hypothetical protein GJ496_000932 [Pomphorhynchus laevis]|nr:hypothetical protein GJ496_000932 [Pomphorhynchus laevis]
MDQTEENATIDVITGLVKQILQDGIVLQGLPDKNSPNPNVVALKKVGLSHISVPKLGMPARKLANGNELNFVESEPYSFEAREFLRRNLVGKIVSFAANFTIPNTKKEVGYMCLGRNWDLNVAVELLVRGLAVVRSQSLNDPFTRILLELEKSVKEKKLNIWSSGKGISYDPSAEADVKQLFSNSTKEFDAVVEHVRDGCNYRLLLFPSLTHLNVQLVGVNNVQDTIIINSARAFAESNLLQRDVKVILHIPTGTQNTSYATLLFKQNNQDIAGHLLLRGLVMICKWNFKYVQSKEFYTKSEQIAKLERRGCWAIAASSQDGLTPASIEPSNDISIERLDEPGQSFQATVIYTNGTEALQILRTQDKRFMTIFISSIRIMRMPQNALDNETGKSSAMQLPVPFEIREYLRKWLVGKLCNISIDYKFMQNQPPARMKVCCTIVYNELNVAAELVKRGYATVQRYRNDDVNRSMLYADLLNAETVHLNRSDKPKPIQLMPSNNIVKLGGESARARLGIFRQQKYLSAIVEWVLGGSRFNLLVDSTSLITLNLIGIMCPRSDDEDSEMAEIGSKAVNFIKQHFLQRDVYLQIFSLDRNHNCFQGVMMLKQDKEDTNAAVMLLKHGYCILHHSAKFVSSDGQQQHKANAQLFSRYAAIEKEAMDSKRGIWTTKVINEQLSQKNKYVDNNGDIEDDEFSNDKTTNQDIKLSDEVVSVENDKPDKQDVPTTLTSVIQPINVYNAFISNADKRLNVYVQDVQLVQKARQPLLELSRIMNSMTKDEQQNEKVQFKKDRIITVNNEEEGIWARAIILQKLSDDNFDLFLIDTGASMKNVHVSKLRYIPNDCQCAKLPPLAKQIRLAFVKRVIDDDMTQGVQRILAKFSEQGEHFTVKVYYHIDSIEYVTLEVNDVDIISQCMECGYVASCVPTQLPKRLRTSSIYESYRQLENTARLNRIGVWSYCNWVDDADKITDDEK